MIAIEKSVAVMMRNFNTIGAIYATTIQYKGLKNNQMASAA